MKFSRCFLAMVAVLMMAGCASSTHLLDKGSAPLFLKGTFFHGNENRLVLESSEHHYEAVGFEVQSSQNWTELRKRYYGSNPKHWDRITSGLDTQHKTYTAEPVLKAQDGSELSCRLAWQSLQSPIGMCTDQTGEEYSIRFE